MMLMPLKYQCITLVYTNSHKYRENGENQQEHHLILTKYEALHLKAVSENNKIKPTKQKRYKNNKNTKQKA